MGAVFGDGAAGDVVAFFAEEGDEFVVGEGGLFVLGVNEVLHHLFNFARGDFFAFLVFQSFGEEILEGEYAEVGLDILAVDDPGDS